MNQTLYTRGKKKLPIFVVYSTILHFVLYWLYRARKRDVDCLLERDLPLQRALSALLGSLERKCYSVVNFSLCNSQ